eukprot:gene4325-6126_t
MAEMKVPAVWRTSSFLFTFREAYRKADLEQLRKSKNGRAISVLVDDAADGHESTDNPTSERNHKDQIEFWNRINESIQIKKSKQIEPSLITIFMQSLNYVDDNNTQKIVQEVAEVISRLDIINDDVIRFELQKNAMRQTPEAKYELEKDLMQSYYSAIEKLKPGEVVALPGGNELKFNNMIYLVECVSNEKGNDNLYKFTVCNSCDSCEYHASRLDQVTGDVKFCGFITIDKISREKILSTATLYFIVQFKTDGIGKPDVIYETLLPYLAGDLSENRLRRMVDYSASIADADMWIVLADRRGKVAEQETLQILFRYLTSRVGVGQAFSADNIRLALFISNLKRAYEDLVNLPTSHFTMGDKLSLKAACTLTARHCESMCDFSDDKQMISDEISEACGLVHKILEQLEKIQYSDSLSTTMVTDFKGTVNVKRCLFPRWELLSDVTELPEQLTGGSASKESAGVDKLQKIQSAYVDMLLPPQSKESNASPTYVIEVIEKLNEMVRKLNQRSKAGFSAGHKFILAAVEDTFIRVLPLPDNWATSESGIRVFKQRIVLKQLLNIAKVYMAVRIVFEAEEMLPFLRSAKSEGLPALSDITLLALNADGERMLTMAAILAIMDGILRLPTHKSDSPSPVSSVLREQNYYFAVNTWDGTSLSEKLRTSRITDVYSMYCKHRIIQYFGQQVRFADSQIILASKPTLDPSADNMRCGFRTQITKLTGTRAFLRPTATFSMKLEPGMNDSRETMLDFTHAVLNKLGVILPKDRSIERATASELPPDYAELVKFSKASGKKKDGKDESKQKNENNDKQEEYMPEHLQEILGWWYVSTWEKCKEFQYMRDIHTLCKLAFESRHTLLDNYLFFGNRSEENTNIYAISENTWTESISRLNGALDGHFTLQHSIKLKANAVVVANEGEGGEGEGESAGVADDQDENIKNFIMCIKIGTDATAPLLVSSTLINHVRNFDGVKRVTALAIGYRDESELLKEFTAEDKLNPDLLWTNYVVIKPYNEVDIMYSRPKSGQLQLGNSAMTEADVETLLSFSNTPNVSIPLVLEFIENGRVDLLSSSDARIFIESLLYESGEYCSDPIVIQDIPSTKPFGTRYGVLFEEVWKDPESILSGAVRLSYATAKLCSSIGFRNKLVDAFLFILQLNRTLLLCSANIDEFVKDGLNEDVRNVWQDHLQQFMVDIALPIVTNWLIQADQAGAQGDVVNFSTYAALCEGIKLNILNKKSSKSIYDESIRLCLLNFFACCCYSVQWLNKTINNDYFHLPSRALFLEMQRCREMLMSFTKLDSSDQNGHRYLSKLLEIAQMFAMRQTFYSSAMQISQLDPLLWQNTNDDLFLTERMLQSDHPYPYDLKSVEKVEIVDAPYLILSFDSLSSLGHGRDGAHLSIFQDKEMTELLLDIKPGNDWPGANGAKPLIIKGSSVYLFLVSPGPPEGGRVKSIDEEWGYRVYARAPVSKDFAKRLRDELQEEDPNGQYSLKICREALRATVNNYLDAKSMLKSRSSKNSLANMDYSVSYGEKFWGCFERATGSKSVHLQTFEVFEQSSSLTDLPPQLWTICKDVIKNASGEDQPLSIILEETKTIRTHKVTCARKTESIEFKIREWIQPELVPDRKTLFSNRSKQMLTDMLQSSEIKLLPFRQFCDYGLHGLENMATLNHPILQTNGNIKYLGVFYRKVGFEESVCEVWKSVLKEFLELFIDRKPPLVWILDSADYSLHRPHTLAWISGGKFENSAFFETFTTSQKCAHVFQIKRFAGRSYRSPVYSSNAFDTFSKLPTTHDKIDIRIQKGRNNIRYSPGLHFEILPNSNRQREQGFLFGNLSVVMDDVSLEKEFEKDQNRVGPNHIEIWRSRKMSNKSQRTNSNLAAITNDVSFSEDYDNEEFIDKFLLAGLLPECIMEGYVFWRTGKNVIRGYAVSPDLHPVWQEIKGSNIGAKNYIPLVYKMPGTSSISESESNENDDGKCENDLKNTNFWWRGSELYVRLIHEECGVSAVIQRIQQEVIREDCSDFDQSATMKEIRKKEVAAAQLVRPGTLINASHAEAGSDVFYIRELLVKLQPLSNILFWTQAIPLDSELHDTSIKSPSLPISFIEIPNLSLSFDVVHRSGKMELLCVERSGFYVKPFEYFPKAQQVQLMKLVEGIQDFLLLEDEEGNIEIIVCYRDITRQFMRGSPFHSGFIPIYAAEKIPSKYIVYPVHPSGAYLVMSSTIARLNVIYLKLNAFLYESASKLIDGLFFDYNVVTQWEAELTDKILKVELRTADAIVCRLKFIWKCTENKYLRDHVNNADEDFYMCYQSVKHLISGSNRLSSSTENIIRTKFRVKQEDSDAISSISKKTYKRPILGSILSTRTQTAPNTIKKVISDLTLKKRLIKELLHPSIPDWKPDLSINEKDITDTSVKVKWNRNGSHEFWSRVIYYVIICSTKLEIRDNTKESESPFKIGAWVYVESCKTIGVISGVSNLLFEKSKTFEVSFPGVPINLLGNEINLHETPHAVWLTEQDMILWDVRIELFVGRDTSEGLLTGLTPATTYSMQLFAMTIDGIRSQIASSGCQLKNSVIPPLPAVEKGDDAVSSEEKDEKPEENSEKKSEVEEGFVESDFAPASELIQQGSWYSEMRMWRFPRYSRARDALDSGINRKFPGNMINGLRAQMWAKRNYQLWFYREFSPHPTFSNYLIDAYEIMTGNLSWTVQDMMKSNLKEKNQVSSNNKGHQLHILPGTRVEIVPSELSTYYDGPEEYQRGVLIKCNAIEATVQLDDDRTISHIPLNIIFKENALSDETNTWRCLAKDCGKVNDLRAIACGICHNPLPLHSYQQDLTENSKSIKKVSSGWSNRWQTLTEQEVCGDSISFATLTLLCKIVRVADRSEREDFDKFPSFFQAELEAMMLVVFAIVQCSLGLIPVDSTDRSSAEEFVKQLPVFPFDEFSRSLHDSGNFSFDHGIGYAFFEQLAEVCNLIIDTSLWTRISNLYILSSEAKNQLCAPIIPQSFVERRENQVLFRDEVGNKLELMRSTLFSYEEQMSSRPLSKFQKDVDRLFSLSKICKELVTISKIPQVLGSNDKHSKNLSPVKTEVKNVMNELDLQLKQFLTNEAERSGKDSTAAAILKDMEDHPLKLTTESNVISISDFVVNFDKMKSLLQGTLMISDFGPNLQWIFQDSNTLMSRIKEDLTSLQVQLRKNVILSSEWMIEKSRKVPSNGADKKHLLRNLSELNPKLALEDLVKGLLSSTVNEDLSEIFKIDGTELCDVTITMVVGTILAQHVGRCSKDVRVLIKELKSLQSDVIKLGLLVDSSFSVRQLDRFDSIGLINKALDDTLVNKPLDGIVYELALTNTKQMRHEVQKLENLVKGDLDEEEIRQCVDTLLQAYDMNFEQVANVIKDEENFDKDKLLSLSKRGMCVGDKLILVANRASEFGSDMTTYLEDLRSSILSRILLIQHISAGLAQLIASDHSVLQSSSPKDKVVVNPQYLVFEFMTGFMLRKGQIDKINELYQKCSDERHQSAVHELIMGSGKTACIGPMLCLLLAKGRRAAIQIVPDPLIDQTRSVLQQVFGSVVVKRVILLSFSRETFDGSQVEPLEELKQRLIDARNGGHIILFSPSQIKKLLLKFVDLTTLVKELNPLVALPVSCLPAIVRPILKDIVQFYAKPSVRKLEMMSSILSLFRSEDQSYPGRSNNENEMGAVAIIDECDMIFDPLKSELNFPVGNKEQVELGKWRWQFTMMIMHGLFAAASDNDYIPPFIQTIHEGWQVKIQHIREILSSGVSQLFLQKKPSLLLLNKQWYSEHMAIPVAEWAWLWIYSTAQITNSIENDVICCTKDNAIHYLAGLSSKCVTESRDGFIFSKTVLEFARKWITSLLPHCLSKRHGIEYGLLQGKHLKSWEERNIKASLNDNRLMLAVPFQGLETPSAFSEFASPDVSIGFTCLAYHNEGLRFEDIKVIISHMRYRMLNVDHGPYRQREHRRQFESFKEDGQFWSPNSEDVDDLKRIPSLEHLQTGDENIDVLLTIHKYFSLQPSAQWHYLDTYVFPKAMRFQVNKLQASGVDIGSSMMFASRIGFSGTPSNLLPLSLRDCVVEDGTRADVVRVLINPAIVSCEQYSILSAESTIQLLECASRGEFHALVDTGALITGLTNREIAHELIKRLPNKFQAVIYIDNSGTKRVLLRGEDLSASAKLLSDVRIPENQRFTFYDQVHTTGIDIKQSVDAVCLLTIGKGMTLRDLMQGAWRMRGIGKGQTIRYQMTTEVSQLINRELSTGNHNVDNDEYSMSNPPPVQIITWLIRAQIKLEEMQQMMLSVACVSNVWRRSAMERLLSIFAQKKTEKEMIALDSTDVKAPLFTSAFISTESLRSEIKRVDVEPAKELAEETPNNDSNDNNEMNRSCNQIMNMLCLDVTDYSKVKSWLNHQIHALQDEKIRCPDCKKIVPEHNDSCVAKPPDANAKKKYPINFEKFELFDSEGPIQYAIDSLNKLKAQHNDILLVWWNKPVIDPTVFGGYTVRSFRESCVKLKKQNLKTLEAKQEAYYKLLSEFDRDINSYGNLKLLQCKNGKVKILNAESRLFGSKPKEEHKSSEEGVTFEDIILDGFTIEIDEPIRAINTNSIDIFKEVVHYPAGDDGNDKLSDKLLQAWKSNAGLLDKKSYIYSIPAPGSLKEWSADAELTFYINRLQEIEEEKDISSGLDSEQEQEQMVEVEQEAVQKEDTRVYSRLLYRKQDFNWPMSLLDTRNNMEQYVDTEKIAQFYDLSRLISIKPLPEVPLVQLVKQPDIIISSNFCLPDFHLFGEEVTPGSKALLRVARCAAVIERGIDLNPQLMMINLEEAQSLRWAILNHQTNSLKNIRSISLISPNGYYLGQYLKEAEKDSFSYQKSFTNDIAATVAVNHPRSYGDDKRKYFLYGLFQVFRLYNTELFFSPTEATHLLLALQSPEFSSGWVDQQLQCRPRTGLDGVSSLAPPIRNLLASDCNSNPEKFIAFNKTKNVGKIVQTIREKILDDEHGVSLDPSFQYEVFRSAFLHLSEGNSVTPIPKQKFAEGLIRIIGGDFGKQVTKMEEFLEVGDTDGNGKITLEEFVSIVLEPTLAEEVLLSRNEVYKDIKRDRDMITDNNSKAKESANLFSSNTKGEKFRMEAKDTTIIKKSDVVALQTSRLSFHVMSKLSSIAEPSVANGENLILHTSLIRCPTSSYVKTAIIPNSVILIPYGRIDKFFYEVVILKCKGSASIGWVDGLWNGQNNEKSMWTISIQPAVADMKEKGSYRVNSTIMCNAGDVIGCLVDFNGKSARFFVNGEAVEGILQINWQFFLSPVIEFETGFEFDINLGQRGFKIAPIIADVRPVFFTVALLIREFISESTSALDFNPSFPNVCYSNKVVSTDSKSYLKLKLKSFSQRSTNILFRDCALLSGKWFVEVEVEGNPYYPWRSYSGIGCVGLDFSPQISSSLDRNQLWMAYPLRNLISYGNSESLYTEERFRWEDRTSRVQMRVDMDERKIQFYIRTPPTDDGELRLVASFECIQHSVLRPILSIVGYQQIYVLKDLPKVIDGYKNIVKVNANPATQIVMRAATPPTVKNIVSTSGSSFIAMNEISVKSVDGYPSMIGNINPINWSAGSVYYELHIHELGGEGRGVLSRDRSVAYEGGQFTIGWATTDFRGESYNFKGVGDDRHSWGLRAADPRAWNNWAADGNEGKGPCFVHCNIPSLWEDGGKPIPQHPQESNRCVTSGDVIGCSFNFETGENNFYLFRRKGLLSKFEEVSKTNSLIKFEDFAASESSEESFELIVPDTLDKEALKLKSQFVINRRKVGGILPAFSLHPNCQVSLNLGEKEFELNKVLTGKQPETSNQSLVGKSLSKMPKSNKRENNSAMKNSFSVASNGEMLYSVAFAHENQYPQAKDKIRRMSVRLVHQVSTSSFSNQAIDYGKELFQFWLSETEINRRHKLLNNFIFKPPVLTQYAKRYAAETSSIGEPHSWFPTASSYKIRNSIQNGKGYSIEIVCRKSIEELREGEESGDWTKAMDCYVSGKIPLFTSVRLKNVSTTGVDKVVDLVKSAEGKYVQEVSLLGVKAQKSSIAELMKYLHNCNELSFLQLDRLYVSDSVGGVIDKTVLGFTPLHFPRSIRYLSLRNCKLSSEALRGMFNALGEMPLQHLILSGNPAVQECVQDLMDALSTSISLIHLDISDCDIRAAGALSLCEMVTDCEQMSYLNLSGCKLGPTGILPLTRTILATHQNLTTLDLSRNNIGYIGARYISASLKLNRSLRRLNLSSNSFGTRGAIELADGLGNNIGLEELFLDENDINDEGALVFGQAVCNHSDLKVFSCRDDSISTESEVLLIMSLKSVPLQMLFVGEGEALLNLIGTEAVREFFNFPLTYSIRHRWIKLAKYLSTVRNTVHIRSGNDRNDDDDNEEDQDKGSGVASYATKKFQVEDEDAVDALHLLLSASDDLYPLAERLDMLKAMIGEGSTDGLIKRKLYNVMWFTPMRSNVISNSMVEYLEDVWCCGAYRSPPSMSVSLEEPPGGWWRIGGADYSDKKENVSLKSRDDAFISAWLKLKEESYRYAEHGFWSVYWCPQKRRSFCHDRRNNSSGRFFWLPNASEAGMLRTSEPDKKLLDDAELQAELMRIDEFAQQGLLYLEDEAIEWLADLLRENVSSIRTVGLLYTLHNNRSKLEKRCHESMDYVRSYLENVEFNYTKHPAAIQLSHAIKYVLCVAWYNVKELKNRNIRGLVVPWLRRVPLLEGEMRTILLSALKAGQYKTLTYLLARHHKSHLLLCEVDARNKPIKPGYPILETHNPPERLVSQNNLRLSYLRDSALSNKTGDINSLVLKQNPDLLLVQSRIISVQVSRGESALFIAARNGQVHLVQTLLDLGASFDTGESFQDLRSLLFDMCSIASSLEYEEQIMVNQALMVLKLLEDSWNDNSRPIIPLALHPLYAAVMHNNTSLVKAFLSDPTKMSSFMSGAILSSATNSETNYMMTVDHGWTLLSRAVYSGHIPIVKILLNAKAAVLYDLRSFMISSYKTKNKITPYGSAKIYPLAVEGKNNSSSFGNPIGRLMSSVSIKSSMTERDLDKIPTIELMAPEVTGRNRPFLVPDAYVVALLRVKRQYLLIESMQRNRTRLGFKKDKSNELGIEQDLDASLYATAKKKRELAREVLRLLSTNANVSNRRYSWITTYALRQAIIYIIFVAFFTFAVIWNSNLKSSKFAFNNIVQSKVTGNTLPFDDSSPALKLFTDIGTEGDMWSFLTGTFIPNLYPSGFDGGWLDEHNRLIGAIRLSQTRDERVCTASVDGVWTDLAPEQSEVGTKSCYNYVIGNSNNHSYDNILGFNGTEVSNTINNLQYNSWFDGATRAVTLQYVVGNAQENLLQLAQLQIKFPSTGDAMSNSQFLVLPISAVAPFGGADISLLLIGILFLLFISGEVEEFARVGVKRYISDKWNGFELIINILGLTWCGLVVHARANGVSRLHNFSQSDGPYGGDSLNLWVVGNGYAIAEFIGSVALMGAYMKVIKYLQYLPFIGPDMLALLSTLLSVRVLTFTIFLIFIFIAVGVGVFVRFGGNVLEFSSFGVSVFAMFNTLLGNSYFNQLVGGDEHQLINPANSNGTGLFFFLLLSFVISLVLSNLFINVTGSVYDIEHDNSLMNWEKAVDSLMMEDAWQQARNNHDIQFYSKLFRRFYSFLCNVDFGLFHQHNKQDKLKELMTRDFTKVEDAKFYEKELENQKNKLKKIENEISKLEKSLFSQDNKWMNPGTGHARGNNDKNQVKNDHRIGQHHHPMEGNPAGNDQKEEKNDDLDLEEGSSVHDTHDHDYRTGGLTTRGFSMPLFSNQLRDWYWERQEGLSLLHHQRDECKERMEDCIRNLERLGYDVYSQSSWWTKEERNPPEEALLLDDIEDDALLAWEDMKTDETK